MVTPEAIEAALAASTQHIWLGSVLHKCKCGWKPRKDENLAIEIATHQTTVKLTAAAPIIAAQAKAEADTHRAAILAEVSAERDRQDVKWGEQNHPNGTGDDVAFMHGVELPKPHENIAHTMGALAYTARLVTDGCAANGTVTWADILLEEVGEAFAERDATTLRAELIQVAAVAAQWVEAIDRARAASIESEAS